MKIGIDVTEISRIKAAAEKNANFLERVFSENEIEYFSKGRIKWESAAGSFAAKEAFSKYLGTGIRDISFRDIEILHDEPGAPYIKFKGERTDAAVSITHSGNIAVAVVSSADRKNSTHSDYIKSLVPKRNRDAHKGQCGKVFILAGSKGMTGAAYLAAMGALRSGAGLVTVGTAESQREILAVKLNEAMTEGFAERSGCIGLKDKEKILAAADSADAFVIGPGLGREIETKELVLYLAENVKTTMIIDADGLNALSANIDILKKRKGKTVLTPHEGEMARLCGCEAGEIHNNRRAAAEKFAKTYKTVLALKGHKTLVCGNCETFVNPTGNPGMATGGSGDVLAGIVAGFSAQGLNPYDAAVLGVYVHGAAGDLAAADKGEHGLIASDIAENISYAVKELMED